MRKGSLAIVVAVLLLRVVAPTHAFSSADLLPFGNFFGLRQGCGACEEPCKFILPPIVYVGWNDDPRGVVWHEEGTGLGLLTGGYKFSQGHRVRGWWLGVTQSVNLSQNLAVLGGGWYLFPLGNEGTEFYNLVGAGSIDRTWSIKDEWWFVDGLAAFSPSDAGGFALLAGIRYDSSYSRYDSPYTTSVNSIPSNGETIKSQAWIPLIGAQYAHRGPLTTISTRFVGFPTLGGTFRAKESFGDFSLESRGNYRGGYFMEFFAEGSHNFGGTNIGVFVRWNDLHAKMPSLSMSFPGFPLGTTTDFDLDRHSWTVGGSVSVSF